MIASSVVGNIPLIRQHGVYAFPIERC